MKCIDPSLCVLVYLQYISTDVGTRLVRRRICQLFVQIHHRRIHIIRIQFKYKRKHSVLRGFAFSSLKRAMKRKMAAPCACAFALYMERVSIISIINLHLAFVTKIKRNYTFSFYANSNRYSHRAINKMQLVCVRRNEWQPSNQCSRVQTQRLNWEFFKDR